MSGMAFDLGSGAGFARAGFARAVLARAVFVGAAFAGVAMAYPLKVSCEPHLCSRWSNRSSSGQRMHTRCTSGHITPELDGTHTQHPDIENPLHRSIPP